MARREKNIGQRVGIFMGGLLLVFTVTLAIIVGNRLSNEALGVLAGAVCGVGAAIPTSLIVVALTLKLRQDEPEEKTSYPPIVVVNGERQQPQAPSYPQIARRSSREREWIDVKPLGD
jgi:hypothetical protein